MTDAPDAERERRIAANCRKFIQSDIPTLGDKLAGRVTYARYRYPDLADAIDRFVSELKRQKVGEGSPAVGERMPDFSLTRSDGSRAELAHYTAKGPVILTFFRGRWCPYCAITMESVAFFAQKISELAITIVGVTPEIPDLLEDLAGDCGVEVLCDANAAYAKAIRLGVDISPELMAQYHRHGFKPLVDNAERGRRIPISASYLISKEGVILDRHFDLNFRNRLPLEKFVYAAIDEAYPTS